MIKKAITGVLVFTGICFQAKAGTGYAKDGLEGALLMVCFLFLVAGILEGVHYLGKNRKSLLERMKSFIRKSLAYPCR